MLGELELQNCLQFINKYVCCHLETHLVQPTGWDTSTLNMMSIVSSSHQRPETLN